MNNADVCVLLGVVSIVTRIIFGIIVIVIAWFMIQGQTELWRKIAIGGFWAFIYFYKTLAPANFRLVFFIIIFVIASSFLINQSAITVSKEPVYLFYGILATIVANAIFIGVLYSLPKDKISISKQKASSFFQSIPVKIVTILILGVIETILFGRDIKLMLEEYRFTIGIIEFASSFLSALIIFTILKTQNKH